MGYDCCITNETNWFRYRAVAIIIENDSILLASNENAYPTFFREKLLNMGSGIEHIVNIERK